MQTNNFIKQKETENPLITKTFIFKSIILGSFIFSIFAIGFLLGSSINSSVIAEEREVFLDTPLFRQVKLVIGEKFISWKSSSTLPTNKDLEYGMIKGYVDSFKDPYTIFFTPKEAKSFAEDVKGSFGGVGMNVGMKDGNIIVISPIKDSPAMKAGIKAGDVITAVNGESMLGLSSDDAVSKIRGKLDTQVIITVLHKNAKETTDIKIVRKEIKIPTLDTENKEGVFVVKLYNFSSESPELFREAMNKFISSGLKYLIIDLRGNPGGYLEAAVNIASYFLKEGQIVLSEKQGKDETVVNHRSSGIIGLPGKIKLVILIDEGSASASEILAGALRDHNVAKVVGVKSFGKGSVQSLIDLDDGSSIKVTVAKWYTPGGINISESGIKPDIEVRQSTSTPKGWKGVYDPQLIKAIEVVKSIQ